jgi:hypothetical protein
VNKIEYQRLATLNLSVLATLSTDEVLELHPLIEVNKLKFRKAKKTKPIKVKPINSILSDTSVHSKILLATLEGNQTLKTNSFMCWGIDNDVWQQAEDKLHQKYLLQHIDPDGWIHCVPKADVVALVALIEGKGPLGGFSLIGQWGEERAINGKKAYIQYGVSGDYVVQNVTDLSDVYRIDKRIFDNTYEFDS